MVSWALSSSPMSVHCLRIRPCSSPGPDRGDVAGAASYVCEVLASFVIVSDLRRWMKAAPLVGRAPQEVCGPGRPAVFRAMPAAQEAQAVREVHRPAHALQREADGQVLVTRQRAEAAELQQIGLTERH